MRGRPFQPGNKMGRGRPPGSRNKRTVFAEAMEKNGLALIQQCQLQALKGDATAMRLCMERLLPPCKTAGGRFALPPLGNAADMVQALPAILKAVSRGQLSAQEGEAIASMLEFQRRALEMEQFEKRLKAVEETAGKDRQPP